MTWTFSEILIKIQKFSFKKVHLKLSVKCRPFCLGLNVLTFMCRRPNAPNLQHTITIGSLLTKFIGTESYSKWCYLSIKYKNTCYSYTETETIWPSIWRPPFQMYSLDWMLSYFAPNFSERYSQAHYWQYGNIGSDNGLARTGDEPSTQPMVA